MSKRDPDYDPELAKQIMANVRAQSAEGGGEALPTGFAGLKARWHVGFIGTEPAPARRPVARTYLALWGTLVALLLTLAGSVDAGGAVIIAGLLIGAPKAWTWAHDQPGAGLWVIGLVLAVIGEIIWATGGVSAHGTLATHSGSSTALVSTLFGGFAAVLGYFRRWGTGGSSLAGTSVRNDGEAAVLAEAARRESSGGGA